MDQLTKWVSGRPHSSEAAAARRLADSLTGAAEQGAAASSRGADLEAWGEAASIFPSFHLSIFHFTSHAGLSALLST